MRFLKQLVCIILVLCTVVSLAAFGAAAGGDSVSEPIVFRDIEGWAEAHGGSAHWARSYISFWANRRAKGEDSYVIGGYADGSFCPDNLITRGAVSAILFRALGFERTGVSADFIDVPKDNVFYRAVMACADNGVVNGYGGNSFRPAANVSRQAAIAMIARGVMSEESYREFSDTAKNRAYLSSLWSDYKSISEVFYPEFCYLAKYGNLDGFSDGTVRPVSYITRAQFVKLLYAAVYSDASVYRLDVSISDSLGNSVSATARYLTAQSGLLEALLPIAESRRNELGDIFPSSYLRSLYNEALSLAKDGSSKSWSEFVNALCAEAGADDSVRLLFSDVDAAIGDMSVGKNYVFTFTDKAEGRADIVYKATLKVSVI